MASTSAEESVRAVPAHAVGEQVAARIPVFAGDVVPAKEPEPRSTCTSLHMAGASLPLVRRDDEIESLFAAPAEAAVRVS